MPSKPIKLLFTAILAVAAIGPSATAQAAQPPVGGCLYTFFREGSDKGSMGTKVTRNGVQYYLDYESSTSIGLTEIYTPSRHCSFKGPHTQIRKEEIFRTWVYTPVSQETQSKIVEHEEIHRVTISAGHKHKTTGGRPIRWKEEIPPHAQPPAGETKNLEEYPACTQMPGAPSNPNCAAGAQG